MGIFPLPKLKTITIGNLAVKPPQWNDLNQRASSKPGAIQGAGLGKALLKDSLLRTAQAADIAGIRALLVHAKDEPASQWYLYWEFEPSPSDPFHLFLLMKDIKDMFGNFNLTVG